MTFDPQEPRRQAACKLTAQSKFGFRLEVTDDITHASRLNADCCGNSHCHRKIGGGWVEPVAASWLLTGALVRSRQERTVNFGNRWRKLKRFTRGARRWLQRLQEMKAEETEAGLLTVQKEKPHFFDEQRRRLTRQSADKTAEMKRVPEPQRRAEPSQLISCGGNQFPIRCQASPLHTTKLPFVTETLSRTVLE